MRLIDQLHEARRADPDPASDDPAIVWETVDLPYCGWCVLVAVAASWTLVGVLGAIAYRAIWG